MIHYVVTTGNGLTERLVEAGSVEEARLRFIRSLAPAYRLAVLTDDDLQVRVATEQDLAAFGKKSADNIGEDQLSWDF